MIKEYKDTLYFIGDLSGWDEGNIDYDLIEYEFEYEVIFNNLKIGLFQPFFKYFMPKQKNYKLIDINIVDYINNKFVQKFNIDLKQLLNIQNEINNSAIELLMNFLYFLHNEIPTMITITDMKKSQYGFILGKLDNSTQQKIYDFFNIIITE